MGLEKFMGSQARDKKSHAVTLQGERHNKVNCPGTNETPGQLSKFCKLKLVNRVMGIASTSTVNDPNNGIVGPMHIPQATPKPKSPSDITTIELKFCTGVNSIKMLGTVGIAISVSEILGNGMGIGPSRQTSGNPKFMTIILFANMAQPFYNSVLVFFR